MANAAPAKAAPLCQFPLPNGHTCRQPSLSGEYICRHHMRTFRHGAQQCAHDEAMDRYVGWLREMSLPQLLFTLSLKLSKIQKTMPRWHEARVTLDFAISELRQTISEHMESPNPVSNPDQPESDEQLDPELYEWMKSMLEAK